MSPMTGEARLLAEELRTPLRRIYRQLRRDAHDDGIPPLRKQLLIAIIDQPGIGVGDLARQENLRSPTISGHINAMVAAGLVERTDAASGDRRRVGLVATRQGNDAIDAHRKRRTDRLAQALANLPAESRNAIRAAIPALNELDL
ncbi:MarR family winged helix-turn-helix transcriptional regulator [Dyella jiangningensis]|uniref:Transcriptional regulator n=1 Tax=Dyella jiangningensis TaxID=1379159 RepID=A0A328PCL3_9GAMM|nr:MarR family winged helix-turn-helix transcriptional regulator [Dyella jiangningensis]RAO77866.1 transcriptional regulator [Dyella jiangningensis]